MSHQLTITLYTAAGVALVETALASADVVELASGCPRTKMLRVTAKVPAPVEVLATGEFCYARLKLSLATAQTKQFKSLPFPLELNSKNFMKGGLCFLGAIDVATVFEPIAMQQPADPAKRYWLFTWSYADPAVGFNSFQGSFATSEDALLEYRSHFIARGCDGYHIVDTQSMLIDDDSE